MMIQLYTVSSLQKVFPDETDFVSEEAGECFSDEVFSFQLVIVPDSDGELSLRVKTDLPLKLFTQKFVKGTPAPQKGDGYYLAGRTEFPDPLLPCGDKIAAEKGKAIAIWVACAGGEAGVHVVEFAVGEAKISYRVTVFEERIDADPVPVTNWMHVDCICDKHGVEPFTPEFYEVFEKYLELYVLGGNTMILTPVFTPPLDTKVGTYRRTCQLVGIKKKKGKYFFDFAKLKYFMDFCGARGIGYFEFSHLLSQWGGQFCPKIEDENGRLLFGWKDRSGGKKYRRFLRFYLPAVRSFLKKSGYEERTYFHLSDEPERKFVGQYIRKSKFLYRYLDRAKTIDAVSDPELFHIPTLNVPVVATIFYRLAGELPRNWMLYYACVGNDHMWTNRFLYMPLQRVRILGYQLYLTKSSGFLHWGFNFYHTQYSLKKIDPYEVTDAGGSFPSGDSFVVYPLGKGATPSIRLFTMREALQDFYALKRLEALYGGEYAANLLRESGMDGISVYPGEIAWHVNLRKKINRLILEKRKNKKESGV